MSGPWNRAINEHERNCPDCQRVIRESIAARAAAPEPTPGLREALARNIGKSGWVNASTPEKTWERALTEADGFLADPDFRAALDASPAPEPTGLDTARQFIERNARRMDPDKEPVMADEDEVNLYGTAGEFRALRALAASPAPEPTPGLREALHLKADLLQRDDSRDYSHQVVRLADVHAIIDEALAARLKEATE